MRNLPSSTKDLIEKLDELYPDAMVVDDMDEIERLKLAGKVELIRYLKHLSNDKAELKDVKA